MSYNLDERDVNERVERLKFSKTMTTTHEKTNSSRGSSSHNALASSKSNPERSIRKRYNLTTGCDDSISANVGSETVDISSTVPKEIGESTAPIPSLIVSANTIGTEVYISEFIAHNTSFSKTLETLQARWANSQQITVELTGKNLLQESFGFACQDFIDILKDRTSGLMTVIELSKQLKWKYLQIVYLIAMIELCFAICDEYIILIALKIVDGLLQLDHDVDQGIIHELYTYRERMGDLFKSKQQQAVDIDTPANQRDTLIACFWFVTLSKDHIMSGEIEIQQKLLSASNLLEIPFDDSTDMLHQYMRSMIDKCVETFRGLQMISAETSTLITQYSKQKAFNQHKRSDNNQNIELVSFVVPKADNVDKLTHVVHIDTVPRSEVEQQETLIPSTIPQERLKPSWWKVFCCTTSAVDDIAVNKQPALFDLPTDRVSDPIERQEFQTQHLVRI
jgi:hypothetical protein